MENKQHCKSRTQLYGGKGRSLEGLRSHFPNDCGFCVELPDCKEEKAVIEMTRFAQVQRQWNYFQQLFHQSYNRLLSVKTVNHQR